MRWSVIVFIESMVKLAIEKLVNRRMCVVMNVSSFEILENNLSLSKSTNIPVESNDTEL